MTAAAWIGAAALVAGLCVLASRRAREVGTVGPWRLALLRLQRDRRAMLGVYILIALVVAAALAPLLAPYDPAAQPDIVALRNHPPSLAHPLGTDPYSRDLLSRMLHGARVSLLVGLLAVSVAITIGGAYGAVAGFAGGRVDATMMRLIDAFLSIPRILLLIAVLALWGGISLPLLIALIGLTGWFAVSRIVRAEVLAVRERDFVLSARALGVGRGRLLLRHVLPNVASPLIVAATLGVGNVIIVEAGLSYLGIGIQPPRPSWGNIILDGTPFLATHPWISLFPGLAIVVTVMAFNIVGDGLRDALDPRSEIVEDGLDADLPSRPIAPYVGGIATPRGTVRPPAVSR